jgi:hypothetical protein
MIRATSNKGFQLTFENGWTISVQFGYGNYCDNGHHPERLALHNKQVVESSDAEIAIWHEVKKDNTGSEYYTFDNGDMVKGYCSPDEVADWIDKVSKW